MGGVSCFSCFSCFSYLSSFSSDYLFHVAGPLADTLFWIAVAAMIVAHWFVFRSTVRGMRAGGRRARGFWEWVWALLPTFALALLLIFTWREMHPGAMTFELPPELALPGGSSR